MNIRNFCILAHIDHGKSTLADRFLELTGTIEKHRMREQFLDMHPLEREKGITIKMQPVRMIWQPPNHTKFPISNFQFPIKEDRDWKLSSLEFTLNLIDTPGHVDFTYEVSRALAAVEGAILLVDATQGVQAQTVANLHLAMDAGLTIIPALNKIDLPSADREKTLEEFYELFGNTDIVPEAISAKEGIGVERLLARVVAEVSPPSRGQEGFSRALIFDSFFDSFQGVIACVRVVDGTIKKGDRIFFMATGARCIALDVGFFVPERTSRHAVTAGEIGYIATGLKEPGSVKVGDTITKFQIPSTELKILDKVGTHSKFQIHVTPLSGYKEPKPLVYASIFPVNQDEYELLRDSLWKLKLNDAALAFEPEAADSALGRGFRCGFLGLLHMEIIAERLRREYELPLVFTSPSVAFQIKARSHADRTQKAEKARMVYSAAKMPESGEIDFIEEPWAKAEIIAPFGFLGALTVLINEKGGVLLDSRVLAGDRLRLLFEIPLREIVVDFYDLLKSVSHGYASLSYEFFGYRAADLVRLDILIAGERVPPFAEIVPRGTAERIARGRLEKLKDLLPREQFAVALQGEVNGRIIARETISALRKDVTGYLYGGDRTRKMKLWQKQKKGKKRLKAAGKVDIPTDVFIKMIRR